MAAMGGIDDRPHHGGECRRIVPGESLEVEYQPLVGVLMGQCGELPREASAKRAICA
jgi:hypothetical protein